MGRAIARYFEALGDGDPVALGFTAVILVIAALLGLFVLITKWRLAAEDERRKKRRGL
jgi:hypothetical protein